MFALFFSVGLTGCLSIQTKQDGYFIVRALLGPGPRVHTGYFRRVGTRSACQNGGDGQGRAGVGVQPGNFSIRLGFRLSREKGVAGWDDESVRLEKQPAPCPRPRAARRRPGRPATPSRARGRRTLRAGGLLPRCCELGEGSGPNI